MPLPPGTRLGLYEISAQIGAGGMGEVYRATDSSLGRFVAIKVLPQAVGSDPDRLARFDREAKTLASLNHPNIAQVYGFENFNGTRVLVMEFVDGPTLADRIADGPIPVDESLAIASQISEALAAAHEQGIVHRDLKPANIKLTPSGTVKVLDFGLAKAIGPAASTMPGLSMSPTITSPAMTQAGVILGTAAYMSPEQARGRDVDERADVWAFGCVLYEMLTGRRAFGGDEITDTLAFIITKDPDWNALPTETPLTVRRVIRRCLAKDPRTRLHDIVDARLEMQDPIVVSEATDFRDVPPASSRWRRSLPWVLTLTTLVVAGLVVWRGQASSIPAAARVVHFTVPLPDDTPPVPGGVALSRDGTRIAFVGGPRAQIYVRPVEGIETRLLQDTAGAAWLSFSPDGRSISYVSPRDLRKVAVDNGGRSEHLADVVTEIAPPVQYWRSDGTILFMNKGVLMRIPAAGGTPEIVGPPGQTYFLPRLALDGPKVLAVNRSTGPVELDIRQRTSAKVSVPVGGSVNCSIAGDFVPANADTSAGFLLCFDPDLGSIAAGRFDQSRHQLVGQLMPVVEGVQQLVGPFGSFAVSDSGTLAYVAGRAQGIAPATLAWVDRTGAEEVLPGTERRFESLSMSPNGSLIAMQVIEGRAIQAAHDIWVYDVARKTSSRLTFDGVNNRGTVWTADGTRIIHESTVPQRSNGNGNGATVKLRSVPVGGGAAETLADVPPGRWVPRSISRDGTWVAGDGNPGDAPQSMMSLLRVGEAGPPQPFMALPGFSQRGARFSPDGRFIAYSSDETGRDEIYVAAYPAGGGKVTVSANGGSAPRWRGDGRELFYRSGNRMMAVEVDTSAGFRAGTPKVLFERERVGGLDEPYDVAPDGRRFLMLKPIAATSTRTELHVVVNWVEQLKRQVPN